MNKLEKIRDNLIEKSTDEKLVRALVTGSVQDPETGEPLFDCYYEEETGYLSDKLTVSSEGFRVITDVLEDLFEQFGFVRFPDKNNLEAVTEFCLISDKLEELFELFGFCRTPTDDLVEEGVKQMDDKLEYAFTEIRIDLIEAFDKAVKRLGEKSK